MMFFLIIYLFLALIPCVLFLVNLRLYRPPLPPGLGDSIPSISVLIPARNEEANIGRALQSVLANRDVTLEVVVLDDHSSDRTAAVVNEFAARDGRVRLELAPPLPPGWCGKQHACAALAGHGRFPLLVFMDADVRLTSNALARMAGLMTATNVALASGVPRQEVGTFWEKVLIPLIHFVLLGFLPIARMRRSRKPAFAAGCGQLFMARADAYRTCGGHGAIRASLHDGLKLPAVFRAHGFMTDLFDATDVATCRMYHNAAEVFSGLAKNATEGLGEPRRIGPLTAILAGGQVVPWVLLLLPGLGTLERMMAAAAIVLSLVPRWLAVRRFAQPWLGALLHPLGVLVLLGIQWGALLRLLLGRPANWRGRACPKLAALLVLGLGGINLSAAPTNVALRVPAFSLRDQHDQTHRFHVPGTNLSFIVVADHKGSDQLAQWIKPVRERHGKELAILGVADVSKVPGPLRSMVQRAFVKQLAYPVLLDWSGDVTRHFIPTAHVANVYLVRTNGAVVGRWSGAVHDGRLSELSAIIAAQPR